MTQKLSGTIALVTGASSGMGAATAVRLTSDSSYVALVARRRDRLEDLAAQIQQAGGTAMVVEADITDRPQAESAVEQAVELPRAVADVRDVRGKSDCSTLCDARREPVHG
jgi:NADP-dependent 3-hydroxy acid dehydrogenase YdfG